MFEKKTVLELKAICKVLGIDVKELKKKIEYLGAIEESGYTWDSYLQKVDKDFTFVEAEVKKETEVKVEVKQKVETLPKEDVVLKMVHPRSALNVSNIITFTIEQPFKVLSAEKAEQILNLARGEVRKATTEEIKSFYGID